MGGTWANLPQNSSHGNFTLLGPQLTQHKCYNTYNNYKYVHYSKIRENGVFFLIYSG